MTTAARRAAYRTTCTSNLRQIGLAFRMYTDDHDSRPYSMSALVSSGHLLELAVAHCQSDPAGNWGGEFYRRSHNPGLPPETVAYSYLTAWQWADWSWRGIVGYAGSSGPVVCQLHGGRATKPTGTPMDYEGSVLRLQKDGAVVVRQIAWEHSDFGTTADTWLLFSDGPAPVPLP